MALSRRLLALYQMVEPGSIVADIGCDHGLLPIALVQNGICDHAYACDLRMAPLSRAIKAIQTVGLQDQILCVQKDGIEDLPKDVDTIVIAGMGFDTIKAILEANMEELHADRKIILQSNKHVRELRKWISDHHFTILQEDLVEEEHFYEIVAFSTEAHAPYSEQEQLFGVALSNHPLFDRYWRYQLHKINRILDHMPKEHEKYFDYHNLAETIFAQIKTAKD